MLLKMPLKNAISNSAAAIVLTAVVGATFKNATLGLHEIPLGESVTIAAMVAPTAVVGGFIGGRLVHVLPRNLVRLALIAVLIAAAWKMLTVTPTV